MFKRVSADNLAERAPAVCSKLHTVRTARQPIFYVLRAGCVWRYCPHGYPPWQTAYVTFRQWRLKGVWQ